MKHPTHNKISSVFILLFSAVFLFVSIIVLAKYFIVTLPGLYEPVLNLVKLILSDENTKKDLMSQVIVVFKILSLIISVGLIFVIYSTLATVFSCIFYSICSRNHKIISHPLKFSIIKGIKWNFYRTFIVLTPPLVIKSAGVFLLFSSVILFNFLLKVAGISISLTAFLISFIAFSLMFLFMLALLISSWQLFLTIFGTEVAISEPRLTNKTIEMRSKKLILSKYSNVLLCISFFALILNIIFQIKYALTTNLLADPANHEFFNSIIMFNLFFLLTFEYLKTSSYINSLVDYNHKISKCPIKVVKS